ncbi:MAG TPA: helix-turn-helix transcriptional regulator [Streptosporangiaceae bacterium]
MKPVITPHSLRDLLRQRGLSYEATAVLAGVDTSAISRIVNGKRQPRPETIVQLARALGISAKRLQAMASAAQEAADADDDAAVPA